MKNVQMVVERMGGAERWFRARGSIQKKAVTGYGTTIANAIENAFSQAKLTKKHEEKIK